MLKLTSNTVEALSFTVPRKGDFFQEDLFPPSFSGVPSHTASEWWAGSSKPPKVMSLDPAVRERGKAGNGGKGALGSSTGLAPKASLGGGGTGGGKPPSGGKTVGQLQRELDVALARISMLESRLRAAGLEYT